MKANPGLKPNELAKKAKEVWNALSAEEKAEWKARAKGGSNAAAAKEEPQGQQPEAAAAKAESQGQQPEAAAAKEEPQSQPQAAATGEEETQPVDSASNGDDA